MYHVTLNAYCLHQEYLIIPISGALDFTQMHNEAAGSPHCKALHLPAQKFRFFVLSHHTVWESTWHRAQNGLGTASSAESVSVSKTLGSSCHNI